MAPIDYNSFGTRPAGKSKDKFAPNPAVTADNYDPSNAWWNESDEYSILAGVKSMTAGLSTDLASRLSRYRVESRLYGIADLMDSMSKSYNNGYNSQVTVPDRLSMNIVQSNVDTLVAKMSKIKPRAKFLTNLGTFKSQKAAKKLGYFSDGIFSENEAYSLSRAIIRDSLVLGDGFIHAFEEGGRVRLERVLPYEILVDELECLSNPQPTHMYRVRLVSRMALMELFPEKAEQIRNSTQLFTFNIHTVSSLTDQIEVLEAWKIGSPGKHLIAVPDCILHHEEWAGKRFPIARLSWTRPFAGYWSQSLSEQLKPIQLELNKLLAVLQRSYHLAGSFKILVQNGSQIPVESFNNNIGTIIKYTGAQPSYITPPILPPEFYRQIDTLITRSYQVSGVSALSATSQKPAGLNSGAALREYNDIESNRFVAFSQDVEQFFVHLAQVSLDVVALIAEKNGGHYPVNKPGPKSLTKLDFSEIGLGEENYTIQVYPASSLPETPAGRISALDDLVQRGLISPVEQRELLDMPDLQAASQLSNAQDEYLKEIFERMLEDTIYTPPEPYDNLQLARKLCLQYYALGKSLGEGEEKMELLRQFLRDLDVLEAPEPIVPQLPQPALGAQISQAEAAQLALPSATGALPGAELAVAAGAQEAGLQLPPTALA